MQDLSGKVAVVTGAGSGIGRALVIAAAGAGMDVAAVDVDLAAAEKTAAAASGRKVLALAVDVADREAVEGLAARVYAELGGAHLLCNNAGVFQIKSLKDTTHADWDWILGVNVEGVVNGVQAFLPRMLAAGGEAHIVNTASMAGLVCGGERPLGVYTTSKYAVVALSEALRKDLADTRVGVSVLCPGAVNTQIADAGRNRPPEFGGPVPAINPNMLLNGMDPSEVARKVLRGVQLNRFYILPHPEGKPRIEERFKELLAAFDEWAAEEV